MQHASQREYFEYLLSNTNEGAPSSHFAPPCGMSLSTPLDVSHHKLILRISYCLTFNSLTLSSKKAVSHICYSLFSIEKNATKREVKTA